MNDPIFVVKYGFTKVSLNATQFPTSEKSHQNGDSTSINCWPQRACCASVS
jgi:hypothetical protein